ncbi:MULTISPECIES: thioesterase family protein [Nocardiaceae]|uniref:Acyl-CoA thioester hydrolase n=1 Tax=Rhodococcoides corynebacterioides TaxID=53972 RepID=A0ABS2KMW9_9NOCA|nr:MULTISPECIES: thioesterase family protein [Rhodococcus]MBM7413319.1 acyl-CoA thioester hydrolase [Rhodococcus corynebacterioides]MBP1115782.1 acyl-CoA thioester hydrolase [Rhodococcus sp. PvP016]
MTFSLSGRVEWVDTDAAGIYHNSTVVRFVESAEAALVRECGLDGYFPVAPRVRYEVDFHAPLYFGQQVTTDLDIAHLGLSSMRFEFAIWGEAFEGRDRALAAKGSYVTVHIDRDVSGAVAAPWPAQWREVLLGLVTAPVETGQDARV